MKMPKMSTVYFQIRRWKPITCIISGAQRQNAPRRSPARSLPRRLWISLLETILHIYRSGDCIRDHDARCAPTLHSHLSLIAIVPVVSSWLPSLSLAEHRRLSSTCYYFLVVIRLTIPPEPLVRGWFHSFRVNFTAFRHHAWPS